MIKIISFVFLFCSFFAQAMIEPQPLSGDKRLRVMVYNPNDVFKYTGFYGYESSIVFSSDETIESITMGDSLAWQMVTNGNRLFLKPIEPEATTNMTIISDKRVYHFELHAENAENINDPDLVFSVKFLYPDDGGSSAVMQFDDVADSTTSDLEKNPKLNYNYTISGPESIAPVKIFDDGTFTYFEFSKITSEIPAFFVVYPDSTEGLVNFKIIGKYVAIERVAMKFTLRLGSQVGCVFNEKLMPAKKDKNNSKNNSTIVPK